MREWTEEGGVEIESPGVLYRVPRDFGKVLQVSVFKRYCSGSAINGKKESRRGFRRHLKRSPMYYTLLQ